jgi:nucleoside-diphosphate-sugar epimerase
VSALLFIARSHSLRNTTTVYNVKDRDILKTNVVVRKICDMYKVNPSKIDILKSSSSEKEIKPTTRENEINSIGWKPKYNFTEGLKLTLNWYNHYFNKLF